jgi:hypothetical protein
MEIILSQNQNLAIQITDLEGKLAVKSSELHYQSTYINGNPKISLL